MSRTYTLFDPERLSKKQADMRERQARITAGRQRHTWRVKNGVVFCRRCGERLTDNPNMREVGYCLPAEVSQ
jgi:ribosomal protein L32E